MISRFNILSKGIGIIVLMFLMLACQDTVPQRSTIIPNKSVGPTPEPPPPAPVVRPSGAIFFKSDFCTCKDGKAVSYGNGCVAFCNGKNTAGTEKFFANFTVTADISLSGLGNVAGWCTALLPGDEVNPKCVLEAKTEDGNKFEVDIDPPKAGTNSITANIQNQLENEKVYVLTLVESGSKARSNSIQMIKFSPDVAIPVLGPLKNAPISQYTCVYRSYSIIQEFDEIFYEAAYRQHFYFLPRVPPAPVPAGTNLVCHDIFNPMYGPIDEELYPRLETIPGVFNLWDLADPRFFDNNGNNLLDIDEIIYQKTRNFGGNIPVGTKFFTQFKTLEPVYENVIRNGSSSTGDPAKEEQPLGYFMAPWIDQQTFKSYCLNQTHYNSNNALFKAMRDIIEVDTEGLYIGEKAAENIVRPDGSVEKGKNDFIWIRETDLKAVWFYIKNGVPTSPTDENVANVAVYFHYPLNKQSPFVKTSTQRIFRVKGSAELNGSVKAGGSGANSEGTNTNYPPHDRKIGCIPKF